MMYPLRSSFSGFTLPFFFSTRGRICQASSSQTFPRSGLPRGFMCELAGDREACTAIRRAHAFIPNLASICSPPHFLYDCISESPQLSFPTLAFLTQICLNPHQTTPTLTLDRRRTKKGKNIVSKRRCTLSLDAYSLRLCLLFQRTFRPSP